jgi:Putative prokaryotic signal transducing protein
VIVGRYLFLPDAQVAKSILDSAGIESFLADENVVRMDWFYSNAVGGIKLLVRHEDAETAKKLLEESSAEPLEGE